MARKRKDRRPASPPALQPETEMERVQKVELQRDLRPDHHEQTRETRGPRFGYWQVGGASRSAIKRLKKP